MSSFFRVAAMTLLSKTLQTFLYKYLSDVDVENIELPSLYSSEDSNSGYGVRLSNVKLRDGAELMNLPGKKKIKKKTRVVLPKKKKKKKIKGDVKNPNDHKDNPVDKGIVREKEVQLDTTFMDNSNNNEEEATIISETSSQSSYTPPTPTQENNSFFCHLPSFLSRKASTTTTTTENVKLHQRKSKSRRIINSDDEEELKRILNDNSLKQENIEKEGDNNSNSHNSTKNKEDSDKNNDNKTDDGNEHDDHYDTQDGDYSSSEHEDDDAEEEKEQSMILRLGKDGFIGSLDIRWVGRELHVLVEDAFVTVECIPKDIEETNDKSVGKEDLNTSSHSTTANSNNNNASKKATAAVEPDSTVVSDRIVASNPIARLLSTIPHLFLRDIRIRLVIKDTADNNDGVDANTNNKTKTTTTSNTKSTTAKSTSAGTWASSYIDHSSSSHEQQQEQELESSQLGTTNTDSILEFGIDFLSVTSGEDFLSKFNLQMNDDSASATLTEAATIADSTIDSAQQIQHDILDNGDTTTSSVGDDGTDFGDKSNSAIDDENGDGTSIELGSNHEYVSKQQGYNSSSKLAGEQSCTIPTILVENDFLYRRIRTGRGPDGGIWLKVFPPRKPKRKSKTTTTCQQRWARQEWMESAQHYFFKCSGLDTRARIYLDTTKTEITPTVTSSVNNSTSGGVSSYVWYGSGSTASNDADNNDEYDSMLYGYDSIAPGDIVAPTTDYSNNKNKFVDHHRLVVGEEEQDEYDVTTYYMDQNGIQSSKGESNFHRVGRGLLPTTCKLNHLPCENCSECWERDKNAQRNKKNNITGNVPIHHQLDSSTPMPGVALSVSFTDPLEMNIDRSALEVLGLVIRLFSKPKQESPMTNGDGGGSQDDDGNSGNTKKEGGDESSTAETETSSKMKAATTATKNEAVFPSSKNFTSTSNHKNADGDNHKEKANKLSSVSVGTAEDGGYRNESPSLTPFPAYMKPEAIQMMGINFSDVLIKIHVMRSDTECNNNYNDHDLGLSFCYWDITARCITIDHHKLAPVTAEKTFSDIRLDIGLFQLTEYKGMCQKQLISLGIPQTEDSISASPRRQSKDANNNNRPPWPTTVCSILEVSPSHESLCYESRERHGVQLRYNKLIDVSSSSADADISRTALNIRLGVTSIDTPYAIKEDIVTIRDEIKKCLFDVPKEETKDAASAKAGTEGQKNNDNAENKENEKPLDSTMKFQIQIDGGRLNLFPLVEIKLPLTRFSGQSSSDMGLCFESFLDHVELKYKPSLLSSNDSRNYDYLSIQKLAELPETVRLRIFLFLEDLTPLEKALGVKNKKASNSFLRCHAVNKRIVKIAKKAAKSKSSTSSSIVYSSSHARSSSPRRRKVSFGKSSLSPSLTASGQATKGSAIARTNMAPSNHTSTSADNNRRQKIMTEILKLDDDALESLLSHHKRRHSRRRRKPETP